MALYSSILRRLLWGIPTFFGTTFIVFFMLNVLPGDPASFMMQYWYISPEVVQRIREQLGFNLPLHLRYLRFLGDIFSGNLGRSAFSGELVSSLLIRRMMNTWMLIAVSFVIALTVGIAIGIFAAYHRNSTYDIIAMVASLFGMSMPQFWAGILLIYLFTYKFRILSQNSPLGILLPAITLALNEMGLLARISRTAILENLQKDYVITARAKGLRELIVAWRHVLRNAWLSILTVFSTRIAAKLGGVVVIEVVFGWPGLGYTLYNAILHRDIPIIQAGIIYLALGVILLNLVTDIIYSYLDPRVRGV